LNVGKLKGCNVVFVVESLKKPNEATSNLTTFQPYNIPTTPLQLHRKCQPRHTVLVGWHHHCLSALFVGMR